MTPLVYEQEARWDMKKHGYQRPLQGFKPIHMPRSTGAGAILAACAMICGFGMIWHIWWVAVAAFVALVGGAIFHSFNYQRDFHIPAEEVLRIEDERSQLLARQV